MKLSASIIGNIQLSAI